MTLPAALLLVVAGFAAGLCGTVAGLASLFSYPALLAAGLPPLVANVTNTVALTATTVGAVAGSRAELSGQGPALCRFAPVVLLGGAAGAALLLLGPAGSFEAVVPWLIAAASVVLILQPRIRLAAERRTAGRDSRVHLSTSAGAFAASVYGGYFGAAAGVLMLAVLLVGLQVSLLEGNALKNVLLGLANTTAALGFAVLGPVDWAAVAPLALGLLAGARLGPALARRLPATALRVGIGVAGLGLAAAIGLGLL
ncbi:MAG: sulfite exporter TauE/SafE family protein [Pseudonocardia sp.]|nr:sulfite exporter TauE/SafE family protein [Pseudonocardia sp.]